MIFERLFFPTSRTGAFNTQVNVNGFIMQLSYRYDAIHQKHLFTLEQNGASVQDVEPRSMMPLNYCLRNLHKFLIVPVNAFNENPIGKKTEFSDVFVSTDGTTCPFNTLFAVDVEGYKVLLNQFND